MKVSLRRTAVLAGVALTIGAGGVVATTAMASAAMAGCRVDYRVTSQWQGGFGADVAITNLGDAVSAWTLTWTFAAGQGISQMWNATATQSGAAVTAQSVTYNSAVATNGTVTFGFNGSWAGANPVPATFALNGTGCTGTPVASPCPSPSPRDSPSPSIGPSVTTSPSRSPSPTPQRKITVWLAGDSTMQNATTCPVGWGSQFAPFFNGNVTVVNSAVGGRSIQTWLYDPNVTTAMNPAGECVIDPATYSERWRAMLDAGTGMKAGDYLFIQFGINDGSRTCNRHVGPARYQELLGVMARAATDRGAHPILLTPVAAISCSGSTATGNRGFLTETFAAGTANRAPVIDLHRLSYTRYNALGLCPNNGDYTSGAVGAFFCDDHTHFEAAGARQIAALVATAVRDQNLPLAAYLT